ncbi:FAD dependent oxidoreductase superfamily [Colletotrichum truncatum]|uniref:FAD dependent oxidoreductase superfamily n=1 Tax=Colletotrichum truncatum TaxID=5467 RepID=A0ACC3Z0A8_COLTU|nr:FAD dependent oxidoreductase superfamily [Colletotrichum truncatum]KAF6800714.1 FAD dependent oxidoreductase superfamily [Colletotrichum truncatum]
MSSTTVILGSGIIGLSIAHYLADHQPGSTIHLVEPSQELFASASGYAGGFLARDWFSPKSASLGALSFDEHTKLAEEHNGRENWGWSASTTYSHSAAPIKKAKKGDDKWLSQGGSRAEVVEAVESPGNGPSWLRRAAGDDVQVIGDSDTTGQVDPLRLCNFLLESCKSQGVHLHHPATALSVGNDLRGELSRVRIGETNSSTETDVPCTRLVIAAGAWSPRVFSQLFPGASIELPISSLAGHSLVVKPPGKDTKQTGCHAIFSTDGDGFSPELFSRVGGHVYLAGVNSPGLTLPSLPGQTPISAAAIAQLKQTAERIINVNKDELEVVRQGLCFRPVTTSGAPILSRIPDSRLGSGVSTRAGAEGGVFVAAGHGPWGISLSLGTGKVMAEMIQGRKLSADISRLALT